MFAVREQKNGGAGAPEEFGSIPNLALHKSGPIWGHFKKPHLNNYLLSINYISNVMDAAPYNFLIYMGEIRTLANRGTIKAPFTLNDDSSHG